MKSGVIFDINEVTLYEGSGLNVAIFLKGCPLRCVWCHNPEGLEPGVTCCQGKEIGVQYTSEELVQVLRQYIPLQSALGGMFIFSGGEPLSQAEFLIETIDLLDYEGIALDTCGFVSEAILRKIIPKVRIFYYDLKLFDSYLHLQYTKRPNEQILKNLNILAEMNRPVVIRIPLIPGITDSEMNLDHLAELVSSMPNVLRVDLLRYNPYTQFKYQSLGMEFLYQEKQGKAIDVQPFEKMGVPFELLEV